LTTVWDPIFTSIPKEEREEFLTDLKDYSMSNFKKFTLRIDTDGKPSYIHHDIRILAIKVGNKI